MPQDNLTTFYYTPSEELLDSQLRTLEFVPKEKMRRDGRRKRERNNKNWKRNERAARNRNHHHEVIKGGVEKRTVKKEWKEGKMF